MASNVLLAATPLAMLGLDALLAWRDGALGEVPADVVIVAEATLVAMCLTQVVKFSVGRARPYTIGASAELLEVPEKADQNLSFFSGHTSFVFAAVAATGVVTTLRRYRLGWLSWVVGVPLAVATGLLRLAADKHWASDVLTGLAVGVAAGVGVPLLFHGLEGGPRLQVTPMPGGLALSGRF
jgi:membrane-associated phospholipid phosphatase